MNFTHKFARATFTLIIVSLLVLFFACKVEPTATKSYTVTIDANGGTLGSLTSKTIDDGNTFPKPSDSELPTKADSEIAYWSTVKDDYSGHFEFDKSPVTKDITIYPHYRYTLAKINSMLTGDWLVSLPGAAGAKFLFRVNYYSKQVYCYATDKNVGAGINLQSNASLKEIMRIMPVDTSITSISYGNVILPVTFTNTADLAFSYVLTNDNIELKCQWKTSGKDNPFNIYGYDSFDSDVIYLNDFVHYSLTSGDATEKIKFLTLSDTDISFEAYNGPATRGIYTATKLK